MTGIMMLILVLIVIVGLVLALRIPTSRTIDDYELKATRNDRKNKILS